MTWDHLPALFAAAERVGPEGSLTSVPRSLEAAEAYVRHALSEQAEGRALPFVIRDLQTDQVVGTTRLASIEYWDSASELPQVVEIGWTWLAREARRTAVNSEAKLLLLRRAFDELGVERVTLKTDSRNHRSRAAIERIGAVFEGILRSHMRAHDGGLRDTAMFSIIRAEWPAVLEKLSRRSADYRATEANPAR
ncbi:MAG: acetyltransferase, ribosomal protein N-acetylase [Myxococcaceae bacterium]|nr:acetyltransferase, ribosomal protein N-acetylase [Myxococcaceae bacterium]